MNLTDDVLIKVQKQYLSFTKSERNLADYVLQKADKVIFSSIAELSESAKVGEATIIRFCKKLGFKGYYSFKMALAQDLPSASYDTKSNADETKTNHDDPLQIIMNNVTNSIENSLSITSATMNSEVFSNVVDMILNAKSVRIYGIGSSGISAMDAKYRFLRIGLPIDSFTDGHMMAIDASLTSSENVVIGISHSGETKDTFMALKIAKESGAKTIAITHYNKSHIAKSADIILHTGAIENPLQGGALATKVTQMFIIEILFNEIFRRTQSQSLVNKKKTSDAISEKII